jgi:TatD DNase family protein
VQAVGAEHLVLETDCPDMTPICCRVAGEAHTRNTPVNLTSVLDELSVLLNMDKQILAEKLWQNTNQCLGLDWKYGNARIS